MVAATASVGSYPLMLTPAFFAPQTVLVVGGGAVAERKIKSLRASGATVRLIAPALTQGLQAMARAGEIEWLARGWESGDVADFQAALLIFAATDNSEVNAAVASEAHTAGRLVNRADNPADCDFVLPGVVRSGEITLAVSTFNHRENYTTLEIPPSDTETENSAVAAHSEVSPALTALLRQKLAENVGPEYSELSLLLRELRPTVQAKVAQTKRAALWRQLVNSPALDLLRAGHQTEARHLLATLVEQAVAA